MHNAFKQRKSPDSVTDVAVSAIQYPSPVLSTSDGQVKAITDHNISITQLKTITHKSYYLYGSFSPPNFTYVLSCPSAREVTQHTLSNLASMPIVEEYKIKGASYSLVMYNTNQVHRIPHDLIPVVNIGDSVSISSIIAGTPILNKHITLFLLKLESYFPSQIQRHAKEKLFSLVSQLRRCLDALKANELALLIYADIFIQQFNQEKKRAENKILSILQTSAPAHSNMKITPTSQNDLSILKMKILREENISPLIKNFFRDKTPITLSLLSNLIYSNTDLHTHIHNYSNPLSTFYHNTNPFLEAFTLAMITAKWQTSDDESVIKNDMISIFHSVFLPKQSDRERVMRRRRYHLAKHSYSKLGAKPITSPAPSISEHEKKEFMFMLRHFMLKTRHLEAEHAFEDRAADYLSITDQTQQPQSRHHQSTSFKRTDNRKPLLQLTVENAIKIAILLQRFRAFPYNDNNDSRMDTPTHSKDKTGCSFEEKTKFKLEDLKEDIDHAYPGCDSLNSPIEQTPPVFSSGLFSPSPPKPIKKHHFDFLKEPSPDFTQKLTAELPPLSQRTQVMPPIKTTGTRASWRR